MTYIVSGGALNSTHSLSHAAWRLYRRFKTDKAYEKFLLVDRKTKHAVNKYETEFEQHLIDSGNVGRFYRYVNNKIISKTGTGVIKSESGEILHKDSDKSERFNSFYSSVYVYDNGTIHLSLEKQDLIVSLT